MTLLTPGHIHLNNSLEFISKCIFFYVLGYTIGTLLEKWQTNKAFKIMANVAIFLALSMSIPNLFMELQQTIPGLFFASVFNTQPSLYSSVF